VRDEDAVGGERSMRSVEELAAEMAARHVRSMGLSRDSLMAECRGLGLDPDRERITPLMYALAVAGGASPPPPHPRDSARPRRSLGPLLQRPAPKAAND
jgi:hypothetical protein